MAKVQSVEPNIADLANGWLKSYKLDYKLEQEALNTEIDSALNDYYSKNGGSGGGYYGGRVSSTKIGTGGSGYINNSKLFDKTMYCYHCEISSDIGTNTLSTNSIYHISDGEFKPLVSSSKKGKGYVKITKIDNSLENYKVACK